MIRFGETTTISQGSLSNYKLISKYVLADDTAWCKKKKKLINSPASIIIQIVEGKLIL